MMRKLKVESIGFGKYDQYPIQDFGTLETNIVDDKHISRWKSYLTILPSLQLVSMSTNYIIHRCVLLVCIWMFISNYRHINMSCSKNYRLHYLSNRSCIYFWQETLHSTKTKCHNYLFCKVTYKTIIFLSEQLSSLINQVSTKYHISLHIS